MPYIKNTSNKDLVFPNGNIELPAGKEVKVSDGDAELIQKNWKFVITVEKKKEPKLASVKKEVKVKKSSKKSK